MSLSRQFKALARASAFFAGVWASIGAIVGAIWGPSLIGSSVISGLTNFAFMYGTTGAIAGAVTALLLARAESGRNLKEVRSSRVAGWGLLGGIAPAGLFSAMALLAGAPLGAVAPLWGLGLAGGIVGGLVTTSATVAAKKGLVVEANQTSSLPRA
jgi:hypothetical protein